LTSVAPTACAQVGDRNQQFKRVQQCPRVLLDSQGSLIRLGQPANELSFGRVYEAAEGSAVLGEALERSGKTVPGSSSTSAGAGAECRQ
jgi:hypothetical protein